MQNYLTKKIDYLQPDITNAYDELPLWSAPFGLLLMDNFPMGTYSNYLDVGCATGGTGIDSTTGFFDFSIFAVDSFCAT